MKSDTKTKREREKKMESIKNGFRRKKLHFFGLGQVTHRAEIIGWFIGRGG